MLKYNRFNKFVCLLIVILILDVSLEIPSANKIKNQDNLCYGFIAKSPDDLEDATGSKINNLIKNMVNDLLREKITVYWNSESFNSKVKKINGCQDIEMFFKKGSFIIPFSGDTVLDKKIIIIISNYNQSSDIEIFSEKVPVYIITEKITINTFELAEVKIIDCIDPYSWGLSFHIEKAGKGGFFNFEFTDYKNLKYKLNNSTCNVLILPGAVPPVIKAFYNVVINDIKYKISNTIRNYVSKGGGYIGSCYGAYIGSSGVLPFPIYFIRKAHNPKLQGLGIFCISDTLTKIIPKNYVWVKSHIVDPDNPIVYGLGEELIDIHYGGPKFVIVGKKSKVVAIFKNSTGKFDGIYNNLLENSPSWIFSKFGKGKVILFSTHPEITDKDDHIIIKGQEDGYGTGKQIISNSYYYASYKDSSILTTSKTKRLTSVTESLKESFFNNENLLKNEIFNEIKSNINETKNTFSDFIYNISKMNNIINLIADKFNINKTKNPDYLNPAKSIEYLIYNLNLFIEYLNKTYQTLFKIEENYYLLENNLNFINQIKELKIELYDRVNKINEMNINGTNLKDDLFQILNNYYKNCKRSFIIENMIGYAFLGFHHHFETGFYYIPQTYFNSLKLLRTNWYNYLTSLST